MWLWWLLGAVALVIAVLVYRYRKRAAGVAAKNHEFDQRMEWRRGGCGGEPGMVD